MTEQTNPQTTQSKTEGVRPTNYGPCYLRSFTDIPFSTQIADAVDAKRAVQMYWGKMSQLEIIVPYMEARYKAIDAIVKKSGVKQVLELAAGWSPRGMIKTWDNPQFNYIETDLSADELTRKREVIQEIMGHVPLNLHHVTFDVLKEDDLARVFALLNREPTAIVHEGLFRYFSHPLKAATLDKIHSILEYVGGGVYATPDIHTREVELVAFKKMNPNMDDVNKDHSQKTKTDIDGNYFDTHAEARIFFGRPGFNIQPHQLGEFVRDFSCTRSQTLNQLVLERAIEITKGLSIWEMTLK